MCCDRHRKVCLGNHAVVYDEHLRAFMTGSIIRVGLHSLGRLLGGFWLAGAVDTCKHAFIMLQARVQPETRRWKRTAA